MKKEFVRVELKNDNTEEYIWISNRKQIATPQELTAYLREGIRKQEISGGLEVKGDKYTKYTFNAKNINPNKPDHYFVVKISNDIINNGSPTANIIKSLAKRSVKQTKKNLTRFIAGATASFILITSSVYIVAKGLKEIKKQVNEYERKTSMGQEYMQNHKLPQYADEQYYEDLRQSALAGDKDAMEEYSNYLMQQQLKEQKYEEERERGYITK